MATQSVNGTTLHYIDQGKGTPLVLMHGFPLDSRMWEAQIGDLSSRFRIIAPDFRGFGKSQAAGPFTVASLAEDIHALVATLDVKQPIIAGLSMGGYVAINYARKFAGSFRALILIDTKDAGDDAAQKETRNRMIEVARTKGSTAIAEMMQPKMLSRDTNEHRPGQVKALRTIMEQCPAQTIEYALAALRDRPDMTEELPKIAVPTLIIVGDADAITPPAMAEGMQKRIRNSRLVVVPGAGHMAPMEQASQVNRVIRQFVESLS